MKNIQILTLMIFLASFFQCQKKDTHVDKDMKQFREKKEKKNEITLNISNEISLDNIYYMKLYNYNEKNNCEQSKAVSIIYNNRLSSCFDYVKKIEGKKVEDIINLVRNPKTYGAEDVACFDTDFSLLLFNKKNEITGYINISNSCNKLISKPKIKEQEFYSQDGLRKVGFSKKGREKIKRLLAI